MANVQIVGYVVGDIGANCYFIKNKDTKEMIVVDPGGNGDILISKIKEEGLKPVAILLTHGHYDHVHHAQMLADEFGISIYCHEAEVDTLAYSSLNVSSHFGQATEYKADELLKDGDQITLAGLLIDVLWTPGHTRGGVCYYIREIEAVFSGDTLFSGSIGRADLPGGNEAIEIQSVKEKLLALPDETVVFPGHMSKTTIGRERVYNYFLK